MALALLCFPDLLRTASTGNVQPLLLAGLAYGIGTRWGPLLIGAAASLKGWPILFALWDRRVLAAVGVAALLILPAFAYNWQDYPSTRQLFTPGTLSIALVVSRVLSRTGRTV